MARLTGAALAARDAAKAELLELLRAGPDCTDRLSVRLAAVGPGDRVRWVYRLLAELAEAGRVTGRMTYERRKRYGFDSAPRQRVAYWTLVT